MGGAGGAADHLLLLGVILWACLRSSGAIMRLVGKGGIEAISRLMGFLLVCMGVQFIINGVLEIISTGIPDRPRCAEKKSPPARYRRAFLCDGFRSGAADGLPAIPASDGISSATRPARPAPEWRRRSRRRPWKDADSRLPTSAPAPMPILKMPENRDMATSVASGAEASTFTCMPRPIIAIATPRRC